MTNSSERARQLERITGTGAEKFWMHHPCDEPEPWGQFTNYDAIFKFAEAYSQAENERLSDQFIEMLSTFGLHRPADKETGPWYRGECHPNCKACDMINAIRSQAATERGEPHAKS